MYAARSTAHLRISAQATQRLNSPTKGIGVKNERSRKRSGEAPVVSVSITSHRRIQGQRTDDLHSHNAKGDIGLAP
jgi:hypothetical protein